MHSATDQVLRFQRVDEAVFDVRAEGGKRDVSVTLLEDHGNVVFEEILEDLCHFLVE